MKKIHISTLAALLLTSVIMVSEVSATDIANPANITGTSPSWIYFDETDSGSGPEWYIEGSNTKYRIYDDIDDTNHNYKIVFDLYHSLNNENSFIVDTSGDIGLADGSVFIDRSADRMGIGTTTPEESLHVKSSGGNMILEGGTYSKWQIATLAGGGFWLRDLLNSSTPFRIDGAAPTSALHISSSGNVGLGTSSPQAKLDVRGDIEATWSGSNTVGDGLTNLITLSATNSDVGSSITSDAGFRLVNGNTSKGWNFRTNSGGDAFQATLQGTGGSEFTVTNATANVSGTELYLGNGAKNIGGVWINASSRALKENIKPLSTKEALTAFKKLQPVSYNYKTDKSEKVVGFIAEDVPELVSINSRDGLSSMDMVAVLTKVVQEQDKALAETKAELKKAQEKIAKLETMQKRLSKVESLLTNLALDTSKSKKEEVAFNIK